MTFPTKFENKNMDDQKNIVITLFMLCQKTVRQIPVGRDLVSHYLTEKWIG